MTQKGKNNLRPGADNRERVMEIANAVGGKGDQENPELAQLAEALEQGKMTETVMPIKGGTVEKGRKR